MWVWFSFWPISWLIYELAVKVVTWRMEVMCVMCSRVISFISSLDVRCLNMLWMRRKIFPQCATFKISKIYAKTSVYSVSQYAVDEKENFPTALNL